MSHIGSGKTLQCMILYQTMGVIIADKSEKIESLYASYWQWHPLVGLIESMQLLDPGRITLMHEKVPVTVTPAEAREIGVRIKMQILPRLKPDKRLLLNVEVTAEPDDLQMHYDDTAKNYSAEAEWLARFADFCLVCDGFKTY
jgi:hypothetical protein